MKTQKFIAAALMAALFSSAAFAQSGKQQAAKYGYPDTDGTYSYTGPKVRFNRYTSAKGGDRQFTTKYIGKLHGRKGKGYAYQGMSVYGDIVLSTQNQGLATIYRFNGDSITTISQFELGCFNKVNHSNVACFGKDFYAKGDPLPLLYVSQAKKEPYKGKKDVLFVERIAPDMKSSETVQTIFYDDVNKDYGWALQWVVDAENGYLYGFGNTITNTTDSNKHRVIKFRLPKISETGADGYVTLHPSDAIENYTWEDVSSFKGNFIDQGLLVSGGKLYVLAGFGKKEAPSELYVWDLRKKELCNKINLMEGTHSELEDLSALSNRSLLVQAQHGLFVIKF
jgi:hypothetical protein